MEKDTEGVDPHAASENLFAGPINLPRPDDDVGDPKLCTILGHDLLMFNFSEAIGITPQLRVVFNRAGLIQHPSLGLPRVTVKRERTDADESPQRPAREAGFEKITRRDHRIHECVGEGLLPCSRSQMKDYGCVSRRSVTVFRRQKVAGDYFDFCLAVAAGDFLKSGRIAGGPRETA